MAHLPKWELFSENLLMKLVPFIHAYLHAKNESEISKKLAIKEYWSLICLEPFLTITWEPGCSQAFNFCRMLMNHKNFHSAQVPDKTNDMIFLKSPQTPFFESFFDHFWSFLPDGDFFQKICLSHITIYGSLTVC